MKLGATVAAPFTSKQTGDTLGGEERPLSFEKTLSKVTGIKCRVADRFCRPFPRPAGAEGGGRRPSPRLRPSSLPALPLGSAWPGWTVVTAASPQGPWARVARFCPTRAQPTGSEGFTTSLVTAAPTPGWWGKAPPGDRGVSCGGTEHPRGQAQRQTTTIDVGPWAESGRFPAPRFSCTLQGGGRGA